MSLKAFFQTVVEILDRADVPYMLTGSLAAAYYAVPRATQDLDVVIEAERSGIERVVHGLRIAGLYVELGAALEAQKVQGQFNAIDPSSGWKVDLIVRRDREYSQVEFGRREQVRLLDVEVSVASLKTYSSPSSNGARLGIRPHSGPMYSSYFSGGGPRSTTRTSRCGWARLAWRMRGIGSAARSRRIGVADPAESEAPVGNIS